MKSTSRPATPAPGARRTRAGSGRAARPPRRASRGLLDDIGRHIDGRTPLGYFMIACLLPAYMTERLGEADDRFFGSGKAPYNYGAGFFYGVLALAELAVGAGLCVTMWGLLKGLAYVARRMQRRSYYPQERARRIALAAERRKIRRRTTMSSCPTAGELLAQWGRVKGAPEDMVRFGSMLEDLEAYVDNSLVFAADGTIAGRRGGVKGWLEANCPELGARYKTVMRYKAMSRKFRQAIGLSDPYPATYAFDDGMPVDSAGHDDTAREADRPCEITLRTSTCGAGRPAAQGSGAARRKAAGDGKSLHETTVRTSRGGGCRGEARRFFAECRKTQRSVLLALDARLAPDMVPREVEMLERRRQGLPARRGLGERLVEMMA